MTMAARRAVFIDYMLAAERGLRFGTTHCLPGVAPPPAFADYIDACVHAVPQT